MANVSGLEAIRKAVKAKAESAAAKRTREELKRLQKEEDARLRKAQLEAEKAAKRIKGELWRSYVEEATQAYNEARSPNMGKLNNSWNRRALKYFKEILLYADRDKTKAVEVIRCGIIFARERVSWVKKQDYLSFTDLAANEKIITWYEAYSSRQSKTKEKLSKGFEAKESLDPNDALYSVEGKEPVLVRLVAKQGDSAKVAFSGGFVDIVSAKQLSPVTELDSYRHADPEVFGHSAGYQRWKEGQRLESGCHDR